MLLLLLLSGQGNQNMYNSHVKVNQSKYLEWHRSGWIQVIGIRHV